MSTNNKRKLATGPIHSSNPDAHHASKRLKLGNHSHPDRDKAPIIHTSESGSTTKSLEFIDFATVVVESITACHAPDGLKTKGKRKAWRDEIRKRAERVQARRFKGSEDGEGVSEKDVNAGGAGFEGGREGTNVRPDFRRVARTRLARPVVQSWHSVGEYEAAYGGGAVESSNVAAAKTAVELNYAGFQGEREGTDVRPDFRRVARTRLARPVVQSWHGVGEYEAAYGGSAVESSSVAAAKTAVELNHAVGQPAPPAAHEATRIETTSAITLRVSRLEHRHVSPPRRAMPIYKPPGLKRFDDLPLPRRSLPRLDDIDDSSESGTDSSEDEDENVQKPPIGASVPESFAERIFTMQDDPDTPDDMEPSNIKQESADSAQGLSEVHTGDHIKTAHCDQHTSDAEVHKHTEASAIISKQSVTSKRARRRARILRERREQSVVLPQTVLTPKIYQASDASIQSLPTPSSQHKATASLDNSSSLAPNTSTVTYRDPNVSLVRPADMVSNKTMAEGKATGNRSGSVRSSSKTSALTELSSNRMSSRQGLFDTDEDSEDVYEAIDDVTEKLLGESLLSMDQCKLPHSRDSAFEAKLDKLMTIDHSARKVPTSQDAIVMMAHDAGDSFENWALEDAAMRPATGEEAAKGGVLPEAERADMAKISDDVADDSAVSPLRSSSSSELTELSRTPSPPNVDERVESTSPALNAIASGISSPVSTFSREYPKVVVPSRRRMTGMSSKHFSPAKKPRLRKSSQPKDQTPGKHYVTAAPVEMVSPLTALMTALNHTVLPSNGTVNQAEDSAATESDNKEAIGDSNFLVGNESTDRRKKKAQKRRNKRADDALGEILADGGHENTSPSARDDAQTPARQTRSDVKTLGSKRRSTGKISEHFITDRVDLYNTTAGGGRVPAGTSRAPVPSINVGTFGLIQEKLWREPFWLIIAVTFLNKTAGRSAVPVFWKLKEKYPASEALAEADQADLLKMVRHLGLQNQRSKRLIQIAKAWTTDPPVAGKRYRTLHYPSHGDGKASTIASVVEEDAEDCAGLLEIGNIPGCGQYAYDSWRIFCRDVLRGVADDYDSANAKTDGFVPEWQRVLPDDKELRACLRWMWLREGWIWDPLTGEKRRATEEEMERAVKGEMEIEDPQERKFAAQAAGVKVNTRRARRGSADTSLDETPVKMSTRPSSDQLEAVSAAPERNKQHESKAGEMTATEQRSDNATQNDTLPPGAAGGDSRASKGQASTAKPEAKPRRRGRSKRGRERDGPEHNQD